MPGQPTIQVLPPEVAERIAAGSPATCPHGRPAFVLLTVEELERRFMRR